MRAALVLVVLGVLSACAAQPSSSERAFLSASEPRASLVAQDAQAIWQGMQHARTADERVARWSR